MTPEPSQWTKMIETNPGHSQWYVERFKKMAEAGQDLLGEARFVDAMAPRGARILDAGCGPGRHGGYLHDRGHTVVGVDVDPYLIETAKKDHPGPTWEVGDLAELDLPARGIAADFDVIMCAGNVMGFLAPSTRVDVLRGFAKHLAVEGRAVVGFGAGRGYEFDAFFADAESAGLVVDLPLATWDLRPYYQGCNFLVAVLRLPN